MSTHKERHTYDNDLSNSYAFLSPAALETFDSMSMAAGGQDITFLR